MKYADRVVSFDTSLSIIGVWPAVKLNVSNVSVFAHDEETTTSSSVK